MSPRRSVTTFDDLFVDALSDPVIDVFVVKAALPLRPVGERSRWLALSGSLLSLASGMIPGRPADALLPHTI